MISRRRSIRSFILALAGAVALLCSLAAASALAAAPHWYILTRSAPTRISPGGQGMMVTQIINLGNAPFVASTADPLKIVDKLPGGTEAQAAMFGRALRGTNGTIDEQNLTCEALPSLSCKFVGTLPPYIPIEVRVPVVEHSASTEQNVIDVEGGNVAEAVRAEAQRPSDDVFEGEHLFGVESFTLTPESESGASDTQAGSHPYQLTTAIAFNEGYGALPGEGPSSKANEGAPTNELPEAPELVKNIDTTLPAGLIANAGLVAGTSEHVIPRCTALQFATILQGNNDECPADTAIGAAVVTFRDAHGGGTGYTTESIPVFNLEPAVGEPARLGFEFEGVPVTLDTALQVGEGYAVEISSSNTSEAVEVLSTVVTVWGVPEAESHNSARGWQCLGGGYREESGEKEPDGEYAHKEPCEEPPAPAPRPYLTLPTECKAQHASLQVESWEKEALPSVVEAPFPALEGCQELPFSPSLKVEPFTHDASTPTGLKVTVTVPQASTLESTEDEAGKAEADVLSTTVTLPAGMLTNAGLANGLQSCTVRSAGFGGGLFHGTATQLEADLAGAGGASFEEALEAGLNGAQGQAFESELASETASQQFTPESQQPEVSRCPAASKIGTVAIQSPLLENPLKGSVYLAKQDTDPFRSSLVLYLMAYDPVSGVRVKLSGEVKIKQEEPDEGQLTTTFSGTPPVPFEKLELTLANEENGERAANTTPPFCGESVTNANFISDSTEAAVGASAGFQITQGPGGSPCPGGTLPFAPSFQAGPTNDQAGAETPFTVTIGHPDGQQALEKIDLQLPPGVAAVIADVTPCTEAEAEAEACGQESLVGRSTSVSGLGGKPVTLSGRLYLTGALKATSTHGAAPFGLLDVTPVEVGPFKLKPVKVLSTLNINEATAAVTVESEQIPKFVQGVPAQLKELNITVERPGGAPFQLNPTNCGALSVTGALAGWEGASSPVAEPFYVTNCAALPFKPTLTATTAGQASKADGANFDVKITSAGLGQANIAKVDLTLPIQLPTRQATLKKACTEAAFDANPASCGEAVIGKATIRTPIFKNPLSGPAYLVSHGGAAFPDIEFVLQGEGVTIVLDGKTDIKKGITYSRFESAPDAAFTSFETELPAGPNSILAAYVASGSEHYNLCKTNLEMPTLITAQDGAVIDPTTRIETTGCGGVEAYKVTKAQLLAKALKACKKDKKKSKRVLCEKQARKKYGAKAAKKKAKAKKKK